MKTTTPQPRAVKARAAKAPPDKKSLVARFAREFMVKPGQSTFDAVGELLRMRGKER